MIRDKIINFVVSFLSRSEKGKEDLHKDAELDFADVQLDIFKSRELYKSLIRKVHPDRFLEKEQKAIAEELSQRVTESKYNYKELQSLRDEAIERLNLKFN